MATIKDAIATMKKNVQAATGKSVAEWVSLAQKSGFAKHGEIVTWLKSTHGIGHAYANLIAKETFKPGDGGDDDLLSAQFSGAKSALLPLYEKLLTILKTFGPDLEIAPKKNNVSIRRSKQFALLQPSTATRLDVGLILKGIAPAGRLEASGSFNAMFTHRVRITQASDIDGELKRWLKAAYDAAG